jgi:DNA-binding NarL/FixJ family response regulator
MRRTRTPRGTPTRHRVLIVDDHRLVRRGLTALIDNEPDLTVCAATATHQAGLAAIAASRPDLVVVDLSLGNGDGLALLKDIRAVHGDLPLLVLTVHGAPVYARQAFGAGANGYVTKQEMGGTVLLAIRRLLKGRKYMSAEIRATLARD